MIVHRHLFLSGYRGSGKSVVGREASTLLGFSFIDTDDLIEAQFGGTIAEIFASHGESKFRDLESNALLSLHDLKDRHVIALGGGAVLRPSNRDVIAQLGCCVWLRASAELLAQRIQGDTLTSARRPALSRLGVLGEIQEKLAERDATYRQVADWIIDTDNDSPSVVARKIAAWYTELR